MKGRRHGRETRMEGEETKEEGDGVGYQYQSL